MLMTLEELKSVGRLFKVAVVADSISRTGNRLVSVQLTYPRFIHAEVMTHRVFSRNAGSSRAIPVKRLLEIVRNNPAFFVWIGENEPGMQAKAEVPLEYQEKFAQEWCELANIVADYAERWSKPVRDGGYNIHKQSANRVLEPFSYINVLVTSELWDNFYELRVHPDAQPEFYELAKLVKQHIDKSLEESTPRLISPSEWHMPYILDEEREQYSEAQLLMASAARCARISINPFDEDKANIEKDFKLCHDLAGARPLHASPFEHQARAIWSGELDDPQLRNNFPNFVQFRKLLEKAGDLTKFLESQH